MYYTTTYASPVGQILLASDGDNLIGAWIEGQKYHGGTLKDAAVQKDDLPVLAAAKAWLDRYFAGGKPGISELPLSPAGSNFRQEVWTILRGIPYGETITYGDIAKTIAAKTGKPRLSAQAVGGAVGHNPISIIIPCHRVVGANGSLTGYAGGIDKKVALLEHEGADLFRLFVPTKGTAL
ncbi:MAG: methylated-DNA--[protein]-cysteine S-methyltransferase [Clostridiales Family XIII bacterium]|nr:methylated-DNA--[protein]-cysteine S-methyltransferase [Clostridiales Family XIII bacterium]